MEDQAAPNSNKLLLAVSRLTGRQRVLSLLLLASILLLVVRWGNASGECELQSDGSETCMLSVTAGGIQRVYQYETRRAVEGAPTVVILPGGPGQGAIGDIQTLSMVQMIPPSFGVIAIDPRGVGRNDYGPDQTGTMYTSAKVAEDVQEVLKAENIKNYIIYGESYGTVVATHLAHQLSRQNTGANSLPLPAAVVLSRIVGPGFNDQLQAYNSQLKRLLKKYSAIESMRIQRGLLEIYKAAYKSNGTAFVQGLMQAMLFNIEASKPGPLSVGPNVQLFFDLMAQNSSLLSSDPVYKMLAHAYSAYANLPTAVPKLAVKNYGMAEQIKCRELSNFGEEAQMGFDFNRLRITLVQSDCESKGYTLDRLYAPQGLQVTGIPMVYLQGDIDPATTLKSARAHYQTQSNLEKVFVQSKGFAHVGMISLWNCRQGLWEAFAQGVASTERQLSNCQDPQVKVNSVLTAEVVD